MNKVIITLVSSEKDFSIDLELEKEQIVSDCIRDIVETLQNFNSAYDFNPETVRLFSERQGIQLDENLSVEEAGVWNGDYIYLMEI